MKQIGLENVKVHIDPTMLIDTREWTLLQKKPSASVPEKYILVYALGDVIYDDDIIQKIARNRREEIIYLGRRSTEIFYAIDPFEFVYLLSHADIVITDSFHGTVFSILFHKSFYVFERADTNNSASMNGRIECLLNLLEIKKRSMDDMINGTAIEIDYEKVDIKLEAERSRTKRYFEQFIEEK